MPPEAHPHAAEVYEDARGRIDVSNPSGGVLLVRMVRHASGGFITPLTVMGARLLATPERIQVFFDLGELLSYDSAARVSVTDWLLTNRARIVSIHVLTRSKLVGMGVAVANLALGGMMVVHREPAPFNVALRSGIRLANRGQDP
jgi:hypothetical protein